MNDKYIVEYLNKIKEKGFIISDSEIKKYKDIFCYFYTFTFIEFNFRYLRYFYVDGNTKNKIRETAKFADLLTLLNYEKNQINCFFSYFRIFELSFKTKLINFILSLPKDEIKRLQTDFPKKINKTEKEPKPWSNNFSEFYEISIGDLDYALLAFSEEQKTSLINYFIGENIDWESFEVIFNTLREVRNLLAHNDSFIGKPIPILKKSTDFNKLAEFLKTKNILIPVDGKIHIGLALKIIDLIKLKNCTNFFNVFNRNFNKNTFKEIVLKQQIWKDVF